MIDNYPLPSNLFYNSSLNLCFTLLGTPNGRTFNGLISFTADDKFTSLSSNISSSSITRIKGCRALAFLIKKQVEFSQLIELLKFLLTSNWLSVREVVACLLVELNADQCRSENPILGLTYSICELKNVFAPIEHQLLTNLDVTQISMALMIFKIYFKSFQFLNSMR